MEIYQEKMKIFARFFVFLLLAISSRIEAGTGDIDHWIIPGFVMAGAKKGGEVTFAINTQDGSADYDYKGKGLVFGFWSGKETEISLEYQAHSVGHVFFGASAGLGGYRSQDSHGIQGTVAIQLFTPFLAFARQQIEMSPRVIARRPIFGLMFKFPIVLHKEEWERGPY